MFLGTACGSSGYISSHCAFTCSACTSAPVATLQVLVFFLDIALWCLSACIVTCCGAMCVTIEYGLSLQTIPHPLGLSNKDESIKVSTLNLYRVCCKVKG